jgi:molybdopterin-containing oxidoreductase family iron-sulfur binding subunit
MDRRDFLKKSGAAIAGASGALGLPMLSACDPNIAREDSPLAGRKWGMVIDLDRCQEDCTACLDACREENNVAFHDDERWEHSEDGIRGRRRKVRAVAMQSL